MYVECPSCKLKWINHQGIINTCQELQDTKKELEKYKVTLNETIEIIDGQYCDEDAMTWIEKIIREFKDKE